MKSQNFLKGKKPNLGKNKTKKMKEKKKSFPLGRVLFSTLKSDITLFHIYRQFKIKSPLKLF
jgi:hypothetical protein